MYLTGLHINDINYTEVIKFEETLVSDYLRHIGEFWKYVTELCLLAGKNGIEISSQFNNGLFDKPFIYDRQLHIPCPNIPHPKRNKTIIKYYNMNTNNIDRQGYWDELPSETQLRRIREENKWKRIQQQPKKKGRGGNRSLRHFRMACQAKELTEQKIKMLIEMQQPLNRNIDNKNRQENDTSTWNSSHMINVSMDQYQNQSNKCQTPKPIPSSTSIQPMKVHHLSKDDWKQSSKLLANYSRLPPDTFKQLILKAIPTTYHDQIQQCLARIKLLKCVRQLANLWCHFFQLKIEEDYWNYVGNLNTSIMDWLSDDISQKIIQQSSINWDPRKTKTNIQYRKTLVQNKLQQTEYNMLKHLCQLSSKFDLKSNIHVKHSIEIVSQALAIILRNDLNPFHVHFEQKKLLLYFTIHDAYLVKSFYDLNPTEKQMDLVQQIWRTKLDSRERLLCEKMKRILPENNTIVNMNLLSTEEFVPVMLAIIEARLVTIEQRTQVIMEFINTPSE
ncbi:unnamed protein product [Rotaria magnacalcarata]|uniref:Uncharacterized protein n=1 Tax=Rotaria magnacalcarata TaxID=392030 RepID=A0A816R1I4_9BILA|nr:unnamed protein product [Rotaria magnacalcarata]CAF4115016.1 unnamed protein product [Rotaria magnacalcarata]